MYEQQTSGITHTQNTNEGHQFEINPPKFEYFLTRYMYCY